MSFWNATKLLLTLHCKESTELMSAGLERDLSAIERWAVRMHVMICRSCRHFRRQLRFLEEAARRHADVPEAIKLRSSVRQDILRQLFPPSDDR